MNHASLALAALALGACAAPQPAPDAPRTPGAVRLVTWNVHDLFDEVDDLAAPGDQDDVPAPAEVEAKLARVGAVLARLDADVVVLQEVEHLALLERLAAGPLAGRGYRAVLTEGRDPRGIDVGVLTRLPVRAVRSHLDAPSAEGGHLWARDLLEVHLAAADRELVVLGAHLVSRREPADARRREQATYARALVDALAAGSAPTAVVLAGDLNDLPESYALAPLFADRVLADAGAALPPDEAWTWSGGGLRERIDDVLLAPGAGLVLGAAVAGGEDVAGASDHRPFTVDLWLDRPL